MDIHLRIDDITRSASELRVAYVLDNRESRDLYVYNLMPDVHGQLGAPSDTRTAELAQTSLLPPHTMFMLLGTVPRRIVNPAVSHYGPLIPDCAKLEAGHSYAATLRAKLPLAAWSYYTAPSREGPAVAVTELRLDAEFVFADETQWVEVRERTKTWRDWLKRSFDPNRYWLARGEVRRVSAVASIAAHELVLHDNPELARFPT